MHLLDSPSIPDLLIELFYKLRKTLQSAQDGGAPKVGLAFGIKFLGYRV